MVSKEYRSGCFIEYLMKLNDIDLKIYSVIMDAEIFYFEHQRTKELTQVSTNHLTQVSINPFQIIDKDEKRTNVNETLLLPH